MDLDSILLMFKYHENNNVSRLRLNPPILNTSTMDTANTVGIIGAGASGLITAHVLLQDGFDVQLLTEDRSPGGVWARPRVYPSMKINKCVPHATLFACPPFVK